MTFVSSRVPPPRVAEMIGMLGTAGFLGTVLGTQLGDYLLATDVVLRSQIETMFVTAALLGSCSLVFAFLATYGQSRPAPSHRPPLTQLIARYHPGIVLLVGVAMGVGLGLPGTFLRTYAASLDIPRIGVFFGIYAPAAIVTRIVTRRLPERFGNRPMILAGVGGMVLSQLSFPVGRRRVAVGHPGRWLRHFPRGAVSLGGGRRLPAVSRSASRAGNDPDARHVGCRTTGRGAAGRRDRPLQRVLGPAGLRDHVRDHVRRARRGRRGVSRQRPSERTPAASVPNRTTIACWSCPSDRRENDARAGHGIVPQRKGDRHRDGNVSQRSEHPRHGASPPFSPRASLAGPMVRPLQGLADDARKLAARDRLG